MPHIDEERMGAGIRHAVDIANAAHATSRDPAFVAACLVRFASVVVGDDQGNRSALARFMASTAHALDPDVTDAPRCHS